MGSLIETFLHRRSLRRWSRTARKAETLGYGDLRSLRASVRELRHRLNRVLQVADSRLIRPVAGQDVIERPLHCDWAHRPNFWRWPVKPSGLAAIPSGTLFGDVIKVFHDCAISEITLHQIRNTREEDLAPFGLQMDVFRFDGSFLSIVIELPEDAVVGLERRHVIRLSTLVELEQPLEIFARLNIKSGPNVEDIVRELSADGSGEHAVEFDLAYSKINEKRVERMWLDLIFEGAEMNQVCLRDVTLTRRPRAEI